MHNNQQAKSAQNWFSFIYVGLAIIIATFGYEWITLVYELFGVSIDHGYEGVAYFSSGLFNIVIGFVGVIIGRVLIGWNSIIH